MGVGLSKRQGQRYTRASERARTELTKETLVSKLNEEPTDRKMISLKEETGSRRGFPELKQKSTERGQSPKTQSLHLQPKTFTIDV